MHKKFAYLSVAVAGLMLTSQASADPSNAVKRRYLPPAAKRDTNNTVGAIWKVEAVNASTRERREVRFRAKDGVLYDNAGNTVGALAATKNPKVTKVTLAPGMALSGTFTAEMAKQGHWNGVLKAGDGQWNCKLTKIDK
jgi:hypothetical protein